MGQAPRPSQALLLGEASQAMVCGILLRNRGKKKRKRSRTLYRRASTGGGDSSATLKMTRFFSPKQNQGKTNNGADTASIQHLRSLTFVLNNRGNRTPARHAGIHVLLLTVQFTDHNPPARQVPRKIHASHLPCAIRPYAREFHLLLRPRETRLKDDGRANDSPPFSLNPRALLMTNAGKCRLRPT